MDWRPPLVHELFAPRHKTFTPILAKYPGAEALSAEIRERLHSGTALEQILREMASRSSAARRRQFLEVPLYLQEVIGEVSAHFMRGGGSRYDSLVGAIEDSHYEQVLYLTVNYDTFLDRALATLHGREHFRHIRHYIDTSERGWSLVKLHGSVDWGRAVRGLRGINGSSIRTLDEMTSTHVLEDCEVIGGHQDSQRFRGDQFLYPGLAVPLAGKTEFVCPQEHVDFAKQFLSDCSDFIFIGFSGADHHVLDLLKPCQIRSCRIVNGQRHSGAAMLRHAADHNSWFGRVVPEDIVDDCGFVAFASHERLKIAFSAKP